MRQPREIVLDILDRLGIDDASRSERVHLAKIIYRTQRDAFFEACNHKTKEEPHVKWFATTRKYGLNGSQA